MSGNTDFYAFMMFIGSITIITGIAIIIIGLTRK